MADLLPRPGQPLSGAFAAEIAQPLQERQVCDQPRFRQQAAEIGVGIDQVRAQPPQVKAPCAPPPCSARLSGGRREKRSCMGAATGAAIIGCRCDKQVTCRTPA